KLASVSVDSATPPCHFSGQEPSPRWVSRRNPYAFSAASHSPATDNPMADSTWSHGSVCPPVNHGISPDDFWTEAIHRPVARTASASRTPGTLGTARARTCSSLRVRTTRSGPRGLAEVEHDRFAEHRVEQLLRGAGDPRPLHDVPLQELVIGLRQRVIVVLRADRALEPPVRRVQRVGAPGAGDLESCSTELVPQLLGGVDAAVSARVGVVVVRELPAHLLRPLPRHGHRRDTARLEDAHQFGDRFGVLGNVLEHLGDQHDVKSAVLVRHGECVADHGLASGAGTALALGLHGGEPLTDLAHLVGVLVERRHIGPTLVELERVPAEARTDVYRAHAGADAQSVEVNGQHAASSCSRMSYSPESGRTSDTSGATCSSISVWSGPMTGPSVRS